MALNASDTPFLMDDGTWVANQLYYSLILSVSLFGTSDMIVLLYGKFLPSG
jgi:hypothetical protein